MHEDMAFPGFSSYCISKGGLRMLMRDLAVELGPEGFTINNVAPGAIATPINKSLLDDKPKLNALLANIPLGRLGDDGRCRKPGSVPRLRRGGLRQRSPPSRLTADSPATITSNSKLWP